MGDVIAPLRTVLHAHGPLPLHVRVAVERTLADLSSRHVARAMEMSHTLYQEIEQGKRALAPDELRRLARILGCTVGRLKGEHALTVPGYRKMGRPRREQAAS